MSTIQNIEAVMQLEQMKRNGLPYEQGVGKTHSVTYATTSIQQSGQMIGRVSCDASSSSASLLVQSRSNDISNGVHGARSSAVMVLSDARMLRCECLRGL